MIEEAQKECLKSLKEYIDLDPFFNGTKKIESDFDNFCFDHCKDIEKTIKLIEEKDKIINLMAEQLAGLAIFDYKKDESLILGDKKDVIKYFKNK